MARECNRQRYISNELTHFVGSKLKSDNERYDCLAKILKGEWITYPPHDKTTQARRGLIIHYNKNITDSTNEMYEPSMVCFCDIPIGDIHIHIEKYSRFGLAFDKEFIASRGGGPVYYVPKNAAPVWPGGEGSGVEREQGFNRGAKECYHLLDDLICADNEWSKKAEDVNNFLGLNIFAFIRCFDHRLADNHLENYYFEREWRILGSLSFKMANVRRILLPEEYARRFREDFPGYCGQLTFV